MQLLRVGVRIFVLFFVALALAGVAGAQDFRGAISGRVLDQSGAALPGVAVTATNVATNVPSSTTTGGEGQYTILYLTPGMYHVTAELSGFKKLDRQNIEVRVGDRLTLDLTLEVGRMEETVSVTAESPLLELGNASSGQVVDEKRISLMPLSDGNPFELARFVPGVSFVGDLKFARPFDNAGTSDVRADGATGGNEFTLDGSPNMASGRRVAFVPPAGAVQEFKVKTASFDASDGHTAGAMIDVTLKSGTNAYKGDSYYYLRDDKLSETDFFLKRAGTPKPPLSYERFGGTLGGPVQLPGYQGKNRSFFFGAIEWLYDEFPEPVTRTVPTEKMRNGDFSELLGIGVQLYDPLTAFRNAAGRIERLPFAGNIIPPNRISAIGQNMLKYYPLPNQAGTANNGLQNNYISTNPRTDDFYSISTRFDHRLTDKQQMFVRFTKNNRREARGAAFGEVNGVIPTGNYLFRKNDGVTVDHVWTKSNTTLLNLRGGWQRFREPNVRQHEGIFDPAALGFSPAVTALFQGARYFPLIDLDQYSDIGDNLAGTTVHSIYSFQPTLTKLMGRHSLRAGYDLRLYKESSFNFNRRAGEYQFRGNFVRQTDSGTGSTNLFGMDVAALLLGSVTGGSIDRVAGRLNYTPYHGMYVQDDWRVTDKLTINLGVRYEYEGSTYEAENRNVRGFDPNATLNITNAAQAAYAANPIAERAASTFKVLGGLQFASPEHRGFWDADKNNVQPRVGFAYALTSKTAVRGGFGIYTVPAIISGVQQSGFSQSTSIQPTTDVGLTFQATLANPFPQGVADPVGNALGVNTNLGQGISGFLPANIENQQNMRYSIGVQRELPHQWLVDFAYVGSHGYDLTTGVDLNFIPAQFLSTSRVRDDATNTFLTASSVANPFLGLIPGQSLGTNALTSRQQLLRPFPQFTGVSTNASDGSSQYHSFQMKVEKRFTHGYTILASYTASRFTERVAKLNATDAEYENRLSGDDTPHRMSLTGIWELPFGKDRRWAHNAVADAIVGGWSVQAIGSLQSGRPLGFGNLYYDGDPSNLKSKYTTDPTQPIWDVSGFYFHDATVQTNGVEDPAKQRNDARKNLASNIRYFPSRIAGIRSQPLNLWDISLVKRVRFGDRMRAQFHIEFLNAFNKTVYSNPSTDPTSANFGRVTQQTNLPRDIQIAAKFVF
jgi:carboxypeptidase family protein